MDIPLMIGYDDMKVLFMISPRIIAISTSAISFNQPTISLDISITIHLIIINPNDTEYHEIIDMEINEKYRYNDIGKDIKLPETNPHSMESELPYHQSNTQTQSVSNISDIQ
jgi:hypothetical protein